jgi:hypothetical protein
MIAEMKFFTLCYQNTVQLRAFTIVSQFTAEHITKISEFVTSARAFNPPNRQMLSFFPLHVRGHLKRDRATPQESIIFPHDMPHCLPHPLLAHLKRQPVHVLIFKQFQLNPVTEL